MTYKTVKCEKCGKEFEISLKRYNDKIKKHEKMYCSKECSSKRARTICRCATCGKEISLTKSQIAQSKSGRVYCSKHCAVIMNNHYKTGKKHPNYTNGIRSYRNFAFNNYPHECEICHWHDDEDILQVHHIDENRKNNKLENLIILCPNCHAKLTIGKYELSHDREEIKLKNPGMA